MHYRGPGRPGTVALADAAREVTIIDRHGGEWQRIEQWRRLAAPAAATGVVEGIGDDAAVLRLRPGMDLVATQDALVEDVHFRRRWTGPEDLAHKLMAVSLSDIAAMGARPRFALVTLALPPDLDLAWSEAFARALGAACRRWRLSLVGGDTVRSPGPLVADGVVLGEVAPGAAVLRRRARPGDALFVTGSIGGAAVGLRLLETPALAEALTPRLVRSARLRLLRPRPRQREGAALAAIAHAMVDLSDGLAGAVEALLRGQAIGAEIWRERLPLHPAVPPLARALGLAPEALALGGGEDYELLAALPPGLEPPAAARAVRVGVVTADDAAWLVGADGRSPLPPGYDAFGSSSSPPQTSTRPPETTPQTAAWPSR